MAISSVELFVSDPHGEYEALSHIMRSGSGALQKAIDACFGDELGDEQRAELATLVCYPHEKLQLLMGASDDVDALCETLYARVRFLLAEFGPEYDVAEEEGELPSLIEALCELVKQALVSRVHLVGDVYDRGPAAEVIMDELMESTNVDVQWGNHDIVWMGAALGQRGCIAHVVRNCARYGNLDILEAGYGMDLSELKSFALEAYADDPCVGYGLKIKTELPEDELQLNIKIQKAMAILQFKVEAQLIDENPSFKLEDRKLLHLIDHDRGTVVVDGVEYEITDPVFPTVDLQDPYKLTEGEEKAMQSLQDAFVSCERLQEHIRYFLDNGSFYKIAGDTLMYHACVPLNADGTLKVVDVYGQECSGRQLFDVMEGYVRDAFFAEDASERKRGADLIWYMWLGEGSPLFAKSKMATFEIYMIADKAARKEVKNPYYALLEDESVLARIFESFGMDPQNSRVVSGHTPVKVKDGENPVKCGGKALIIDGGMSKAYQGTTGIAGFTLVKSEDGVQLAAHKPFVGREAAIAGNIGMESEFAQL